MDYGEDRWIAIGLIDDVVGVAVFTEPGDETRRMISLRKWECARLHLPGETGSPDARAEQNDR